MFFHIFSPTKILEKSVVGGVTLNHLAWASLFGGNFLPVQNRLGQGKEGSLFAFACNAKRFAVAFVFFFLLLLSVFFRTDRRKPFPMFHYYCFSRHVCPLVESADRENVRVI